MFFISVPSACVCVCVYAEWSAAIFTSDVHCCVGRSRAAVHFHLLWGGVQRETHNVGQANISHVGLWTQSECCQWSVFSTACIALAITMHCSTVHTDPIGILLDWLRLCFVGDFLCGCSATAKFNCQWFTVFYLNSFRYLNCKYVACLRI